MAATMFGAVMETGMPIHSSPAVSRVAMLKKQKAQVLKQIEELQRELDRHSEELRQIELNLYVCFNDEVEEIYNSKNVKLTKKELIIEYFNRDTPQEKIAEAVGVSANYVSKVLSEYRKEVGIDLMPRGLKTKQRIIQCLSSGMSINRTAAAVGKTPQYVCAVKKEYEN